MIEIRVCVCNIKWFKYHQSKLLPTIDSIYLWGPAMVIQTVFGVDALMKAMVPQRCFFLVPGPSEDSKTVNVLKCLGQKKTHTH